MLISLLHPSRRGERGLATLTIDRSQLELMKETKELLEQLLETLDVMADKRLLRDIAVSQSQATKGKTRSFRRLMVELRLEPEVHHRSYLKIRKKLSKT
jgi:hypothetical protein